jgi:hypothetical protein
MADIRHRVGITAPKAQVYDALATPYPGDMAISRWG